MALFRFKKDKEEKKVTSPEVSTAPEKKKETSRVSSTTEINYKKDVSAILLRPRITEKSTLQAEKKVFVFEVVPRATKSDVREAIQKVYDVTPRKINMVKIPSKKIRVKNRNTFGRKPGGKKAFVYLKEGDSLDIV